MLTKRLIGSVLALAVLLVAGSTLALAGGDAREGGYEDPIVVGPNDPNDTLPCTDETQAANFGVFSLGEKPTGLQLQNVMRRCDKPQPFDAVVANYVAYIYGDCDLPSSESGESSCQPPLEIQSWPACQRSKADYVRDGKPLSSERLPDLDSAVVYSFEGGRRIEVYSGSTTIVVFSPSPERAQSALSELTQQDPKVPVSDLKRASSQQSGLTAPIDGAMEGELKCA